MMMYVKCTERTPSRKSVWQIVTIRTRIEKIFEGNTRKKDAWYALLVTADLTK